MNQKFKTQFFELEQDDKHSSAIDKLFAEVCETVAVNQMSENVWRILYFYKEDGI